MRQLGLQLNINPDDMNKHIKNLDESSKRYVTKNEWINYIKNSDDNEENIGKIILDPLS